MPLHDYGSIQVWNLRAAWRKLFPHNGATGEVLGKTGAGDSDVDWILSAISADGYSLRLRNSTTGAWHSIRLYGNVGEEVLVISDPEP
jgi:hypothetical protein